MSWISTNNLRRFADNLFHGKLSFSGNVTHNGAVEFNGGVKVNTVKAEFTAPVSFTGTATYKNNEIATKADITGSNITVDSSLSDTSTNPVQNKVINAKINSVIDNPLVGNKVLWDHLHRFGTNFELPSTNPEIGALGVFSSFYYVADVIPNQPTQYGQLINIPADRQDMGGFEGTQLWIEQPDGKMYHRGGNHYDSVSSTPFKRFLDTDDLSAAGVVEGDVSNPNFWWVKLGGKIPLIIQGGYTYVGRRSDVNITLPVSFSHTLGIAGLAVVDEHNAGGRGLEHIKRFSEQSFVYYSGYDISDKWLTWLAFGI